MLPDIQVLLKMVELILQELFLLWARLDFQLMQESLLFEILHLGALCTEAHIRYIIDFCKWVACCYTKSSSDYKLCT